MRASAVIVAELARMDQAAVRFAALAEELEPGPESGICERHGRPLLEDWPGCVECLLEREA